MRPRATVLEPSLLAEILEQAFLILAEIGMDIRGHAMRERLLAHGMKTDPEGRILFDRDTVRWAIEQTPSAFGLFDRDGGLHRTIGGDQVNFVPGSSGLQIQDHRNLETRLATTRDFVDYVRLVDGLEHIAYPATAFSTNDDIEAQVSDAWRLFLVLTQSKKPVVSGAFTEHGVPRMAEMMQLFRRDSDDLRARPMSIFTITATGNFRYSEDSCQNLLDCAELGIPVEIVPVTLMGLIAPVTPVGATVFHVVDVLAGLTMAQIVRPGAPVLFGGAPAAFHMQAATSPMIAVEALQLDLAYVEVAKSLELPTQAYMALSESKFIDAQAGAETYGSALLAALAGVNSVSGPGMLEYLIVFSLPKLVLDNDLCGQALRMVSDVQPLEDLPTLDLAREQLKEEHMLTAAHTLKHWPTQLYLPNPITDRLNRDSWTKAGSKDLMQRAIEQVNVRLSSYQPIDTDSAVVAEMERLIRSGLSSERALPAIPHAEAARPAAGPVRRSGRRRNRPT